MKTFVSKSVEDTARFAREFLADFPREPRGHATVVALTGDLGSGKTTFVQCVAEFLGVRGHVSSPTFLIFKSYPLPFSKGEIERGWKKLIHIDAYRLKSGEELRKLGLDQAFADPANLILIEWADRVADILPPDRTTLSFEFVSEHTRKITHL